RAMPRASAANAVSRKAAKVPLQFAARCSLLKSTSDLRNPERFSSFSACLSATSLSDCLMPSPLQWTPPRSGLEQERLPCSLRLLEPGLPPFERAERLKVDELRSQNMCARR